jgi:hypothetical protein
LCFDGCQYNSFEDTGYVFFRNVGKVFLIAARNVPKEEAKTFYKLYKRQNSAV